MAMVLLFLVSGLGSPLAHAITDTYRETFDSMTDGATVSGVDDWSVSQGETENAMVESGNTATGSGKALKLVSANPAVQTGRSASYGNLSPTWVEYVVKPGMGAEEREVPSTGVAAVTFSSTGKIKASDGSSWVDTGKTFSSDTWYRVILKLDFTTHRYDVYVEPANVPKTPFVPDKQNLSFIDATLNSMSQVGFMGTYKVTSPTDSLADEVTVHYIDKLQFINSPHTAVRGYSSGLITVQLQSANSEPQTAWKDMSLELRSSTQTGEFSLDKDNWTPIASVTLPEGAQQVSFYFKDFVEGRPTISVNEFPDRGYTDATQEQKVVSEGEYFTVTADATQTAGEPFLVQVTAKDASGSPDGTYGGAVDVFLQYVSPTTGSKILEPSSIEGFVNGFKEQSMAYSDAGVVKIVVQDQNNPEKIGYSGDILFLPKSFSVSAEASQIVSKNFGISIKALDKNGQVTPNYQGPAKAEVVALSPAATTGVLNPSDLAAGSFQSGLASLTASYNRWGTASIKVYDTEHPEKAGESAAIKFIPKAISIKIKEPAASRPFHYQAENMEVTVSVLGNDDLPIENYAGTISISATPQFDIPASYVFTEADKGQKKLIIPAGKPGKYTIKISETENQLEKESNEFEVRDATIVVSSSSAPVGSTVVEVQLVDSQGKRIKEENEMTVTLLFQEENANGSVFISDITKPLTFKNGVAKLVVANTEAEVVTFGARSKYGLKTVNGKIVFGRAGASGVGALMLRETKE